MLSLYHPILLLLLSSLLFALWSGAVWDARRRVTPVTGEEWLDCHLTFMLVGVLCIVLGWCVAFFSVSVNFRSVHAVLGTAIAFLIVFVQPHFAYGTNTPIRPVHFFRPLSSIIVLADEGPVKVRHRNVGYALAAAAVFNVALGLWIYSGRFSTAAAMPPSHSHSD